ncbi:MAG: rod shape-determining protein MreD [Chloroflexi bacterium]|nr:rod shape-determining protein MreD [Chloroflexota bacterium]
MKYAVALAGSFLVAILATSVMPYVKVLGVAPDLVLIFAVCWAMIRGQGEALVVVPMAGLLRDLTTSDPVGTSMLALSPIVLLAVIRELRPVESDFLPTLAVVAIASLAYAVVSMAVLTAIGDDVPWGTGMLRVALPSMLVNPLFTVLIYSPMRWLTTRPKRESFGVGSAVQL